MELIIIDYGSTDNTLNTAKSYPVKIIKIQPEEFGHGKTRNLGANLANGTHIVYLTQDAIPYSINWLKELTEPFKDPIGLWPEYVGMSKGEVVIRQLIDMACFGGKDATKELLDRLVGKPKQQIETKKLTMSYQDYLDAIDRNTIDAPQTPTE